VVGCVAESSQTGFCVVKNNEKQSFTGVVLAGGRSVRMGQDKALLTLPDGRTLLERAIETLRQAGASEIIISVGVEKTYGIPGTREVQDTQVGCGPMSGLKAALTAAKFPLCLVLAVDLPKMTATYLSDLMAQSEHGCGVVPTSDDQAEPLAAVYPREAAEEAQRALVEQIYSLQRWVNVLESSQRVRMIPVHAEEQILFANWNTPSDCL